MIGEIRQNFTEASASVGLILATALLLRVFGKVFLYRNSYENENMIEMSVKCYVIC